MAKDIARQSGGILESTTVREHPGESCLHVETPGVEVVVDAVGDAIPQAAFRCG